ncbi:MAG TPA: response regulator [Candidatus Methylomirabilis sp.]|nr:response regulator [Candidatus Methylomirabilis sp.]
MAERRATEKVSTSLQARILVVDDDEGAREFLVDFLRRRGYSVERAPDGERAWTLLNAGPWCDLVITDLNMPVMDGLQLLQRIRERLLPVEVILWTASPGYGLNERAQELKVVAVLTKGEGLDKLLRSVELALTARYGKRGEGGDGD